MNKLLKLFLILWGLYLVWHFGRYYEYRKLEECLWLTEYSVVDPIPNATSELYVTGNWKTGFCR